VNHGANEVILDLAVVQFTRILSPTLNCVVSPRVAAQPGSNDTVQLPLYSQPVWLFKNPLQFLVI